MTGYGRPSYLVGEPAGALEAEQRLQSIRRKVGGLAGEAFRRAKKARELAEKLATQLEGLSHVPLHRHLLKEEAKALAAAFDGLTVPDLRTFDKNPEDVVAEQRRVVRSASEPREGLWLLDDPVEVVGVLHRLFGESSSTPELLDRLAELDAKREED